MEGRTITKVRRMTGAEMRAEGWDWQHPATVLEFDDGTKLYPSQDEEGNGPGALFGMMPDGEPFALYAKEGAA